MAPASTTPSRTMTPTGRRRGRPPSAARLAANLEASTLGAGGSEPPKKKRRYIPGGPGGGGRYVDIDDTTEASAVRATTSAPRPRRPPRADRTLTPALLPPRERSLRVRMPPQAEPEEMRYSSAAAVAAAVVQSEGYKPREERGWEEFHPNLEPEVFLALNLAEEVDGTVKTAPTTPSKQQTDSGLAVGTSTPTNGNRDEVGTPGTAPNGAVNGVTTPTGSATGMTLKRRVGRPTRENSGLFSSRAISAALSHQKTPKTPKALPIHSLRLDLKQPTYRKTDHILSFESRQSYVEKSMMNVGYQESDQFDRPERQLINAYDSVMDDDPDLVPLPTMNGAARGDGETAHHASVPFGRVEYDMDEQDDMWLETYNTSRKQGDLEPITKELFEIAITKIEKEWYALEKRIPKPNPKPPQTHRPRSSSAVAVNGEPQPGEEQDTKCAVCDDGDCENTNAIVFCDGCDLAVHQDCYGVPFIPEGQWLCRKCQLIGRGIPVSLFTLHYSRLICEGR